VHELITPHTHVQQCRGKVIGSGVHMHTYSVVGMGEGWDPPTWLTELITLTSHDCMACCYFSSHSQIS